MASLPQSESVLIPSVVTGWRRSVFPLAIAFLRVGFGLVFLTNGLAKLTGWDGIHPFPGFLIDYDGARNILAFDVQTHPFRPYEWLMNEVVLDHYTPFGVALTATEIAIGLALVFGAFSSLAALIGAAFALHLNFANWDRDIWAWEYAVEWIPLLTLAVIASGRYWGLDARVAARLPARIRRWPFVG